VRNPLERSYWSAIDDGVSVRGRIKPSFLPTARMLVCFSVAEKKKGPTIPGPWLRCSQGWMSRARCPYSDLSDTEGKRL
jgi:hypothetical protein